MAEQMEKVSKKCVNKCKEDLEIPFGKDKKKKADKKKKNDEDDPMADEKSDESGSEKSGSDE
jgi:hypothetical protein